MDTIDLTDSVERLVEEAGLLLVDLTVKNIGRSYLIRILVDRPGRVSIMECAGLSRKVKDAIDSGMLIMNENYRLEVSSPGIGRPLSTEVDWIRSVGRKLLVKLEQDEFCDLLEKYDSGRLIFSEGRELSPAEIVSAVEVLE